MVRSEMNRHDGMTPVVKIRHIKRLLETRTERVPPPPELCTISHEHILRDPEDSDIEQNVNYVENFKIPKEKEIDEIDSDLDPIA